MSGPRPIDPLTHAPRVDLLQRVHDRVRAGGPPAGERLVRLAGELGLPPASLAGLLGDYDELAAPFAPRTCAGTACHLARAPGVDGDGRPVYCLGYCDRSPASLSGVDDLFVGGRAYTAEQPPPSDVRCLAPVPVVTARLLRGDHSSLETARGAGVYEALARALRGPPGAVLEALARSGERGRGGAGFPTATKWRACAETPADLRFVIANGDEGDPGSFVDRELLERDSHAVLEGLVLCGYAVGARHGIVFVRGEYPWARRRMAGAVQQAREAGLLGEGVLGSAFDFDVHVVSGHGAYVCGEETALLEALEGRRAEPRLRPPYPATSGLFGRPTVVNNVETLVNVPAILTLGSQRYRALGTPASAGTKVLSLDHDFARPGLVEVPFGANLADVLLRHEQGGGGGADGQPLEAVLLGGPMGTLLPREDWDVPVCYGAMGDRGIALGHGGVVALPAGFDPAAFLRSLLLFMARESCGKCVPCRLGSQRLLALVERGAGRHEVLRLLDVVALGSLCAFGQLTPNPVRAVLARYGARALPPA